MSDLDRPPLLLVVCAANVCRSPLAALLIGQGLASADGLHGLEVESGGLQVAAGNAMCPVSSSLLTPPTRGAGLSHRSHAITTELVERAGIVLTMEREQRSNIARLVPGSQSKVFTLREAAALLAVVADEGAVVLDGLTPLADAMHRSRGLLPAAPAPRARVWRRPQVDGEHHLSIVDGHNRSGPEHLTTVRAVADASARLVRDIRRLSPA